MAAAVQSGLYQASYNTCAASAIEELLKDLESEKNSSFLQIVVRSSFWNEKKNKTICYQLFQLKQGNIESLWRLEGQGLSTGAGRALDTKGFFYASWQKCWSTLLGGSSHES